MGKLLRKFGREEDPGSMRKHELERLRETESEREMESTDFVDDEDEAPIEEPDGSEDLSD